MLFGWDYVYTATSNNAFISRWSSVILFAPRSAMLVFFSFLPLENYRPNYIGQLCVWYFKWCKSFFRLILPLVGKSFFYIAFLLLAVFNPLACVSTSQIEEKMKALEEFLNNLLAMGHITSPYHLHCEPISRRKKKTAALKAD